MNKSIVFSLLTALSFSACKTAKHVSNDTKEISVIADKASHGVYKETEKREFDLLHTDLDVSFNWTEKQLLGVAKLKLTPVFYDQTVLNLDAKAMDINAVGLIDSLGEVKPVEFTYDGLVISVKLGKVVTRKDTINVFIDYVANPEKVEQPGSEAIHMAKGLYFINADGDHPEKPQQVWTQGETEASSCWFPTIDIPNEKTTQEIRITVQDKFKTLSNGELAYSMLNADGTRSDVWRQEKPHAPYLFMMSVGDYHVIEHDWRDIKVHYFVEPKDSNYAELVFGRTPEMLDYYSDYLGFEYPWAKYDQVLVRDFVSGAMENTSAVIHGEFIMLDSLEYLDQNFEDIIAHELVHHWFGDLLTCESWANLPLNESFATYGSYLWREHKYGREYADMNYHSNLRSYLWESAYKQEDMIRFTYENPMDMFDSHSYAKGSTILHMLRKYIGDEAFFASLKVYLNENAYQTVEIHDLRQAFEKVTGEDLNWFFNQWFMDKGHPSLFYTYSYDAVNDSLILNIEQLQNLEKTPLYKLPIDIDIYHGSRAERKRVWANEKKNRFAFAVDGRPDNVNFDATKSITCEKIEEKPFEAWAHQYRNAPLYLDRYDAFEKVLVHCKDSASKATNDLMWEFMEDKNKNIRMMASYSYPFIQEKDSAELRLKMLDFLTKDPASSVRATAIMVLTKLPENQENVFAIRKALKDSSYMVKAYAIEALYVTDKEFLLKKVSSFENSDNSSIVNSIAKIYAKEGDQAYQAYFQEKFANFTTKKMYLQKSYAAYLQKQSEDSIRSAVKHLEGLASSPFYTDKDKSAMANVLLEMVVHYYSRMNDLKKDIQDEKDSNTRKNDLPAKEARLKKVEESYKLIRESLKNVHEKLNESSMKNIQAQLNRAGIE